MFGYATKETDTLMPLPIHLATASSSGWRSSARTESFPWLRPDGKSQVTIAYEKRAPVAVHTVVVSTQHDESVLDKNDEFPRRPSSYHRAGHQAVHPEEALERRHHLPHQPDG
jgi:S-adenosylmethionine synthetase